VLAVTGRERWIANTVAAQAQVAALGGAPDRAAALLDEARERYAAGDDAIGVAEMQWRSRELAKDVLSPGKEAPRRTLGTS